MIVTEHAAVFPSSGVAAIIFTSPSLVIVSFHRLWSSTLLPTQLQKKSDPFLQKKTAKEKWTLSQKKKLQKKSVRTFPALNLFIRAMFSPFKKKGKEDFAPCNVMNWFDLGYAEIEIAEVGAIHTMRWQQLPQRNDGTDRVINP